MKLFINILVSLMLVLSLGVVSADAVAPKKVLKPSDYSNNVSWKKAVKSGKLLAVNFYVDWCGYCRRFAPVLDSLSKKYDGDVLFVFIDCEAPENMKVVRDYGIRSYPSFYLVDPKSDNRVFINQGFYNNPKLMSREIDRFIKNN